MSTHTTGSTPRTELVGDLSELGNLGGLVDQLLGMSLRALPRMYRPTDRAFVQTVRGPAHDRAALVQEGDNLRYAAIVALGAAWLDEAAQRELLCGISANELARAVALRATDSADLGAVALCVWAAAEVDSSVDASAVARLVHAVEQPTDVPTVDYSWTLSALLAAGRLVDLAAPAERAAARLIEAQGAQGIFPHALPRESLGRLRAHVGCYADQVYPIQALARFSASTGDARALSAANTCADRICALQGSAGQWWWHYDVRTGGVVEGYPVYSVHQHAMGPMALLDLYEAGGVDHRRAVADGLHWLIDHPEMDGELCDQRTGVVWRKIGRREPRKAVRSIRSITTAVSPRLRFRLLDKLFPTTVIDYECRPYELGWMLYAWLSAGVVRDLARTRGVHEAPGNPT